MVIPGTTMNATYTDTPSTPMNPALCGCSGFSPSNPNDVWYRFNTGALTNFEITVNSTNYIGAPGYMRIYQDISNTGLPVYCYCSGSSQQAVGTVYAGGLNANTDYYVAVSPLVGTNGFWGPFDINIFGSSTPLDMIGLFDFDVRNLSMNENEISWNLAADNKIRYFQVQRKNFDGDKFENIQTLLSINGQTNYQISDSDFPIGGSNIYRLAGVSTDNKKSYSQAISILNVSKEKSVQCYPNPGQTSLNIIREKTGIDGSFWAS